MVEGGLLGSVVVRRGYYDNIRFGNAAQAPETPASRASTSSSVHTDGFSGSKGI